MLTPGFVATAIEEDQVRKSDLLGDGLVVDVIRADEDRARDELPHQFHNLGDLREPLARKRWQEEWCLRHDLAAHMNLRSSSEHSRPPAPGTTGIFHTH